MRQIHLATLAGALALLSAAAPSTRAATPANPLAGTSERFEAAVARGDAAALADMFTTDGEIMPPNGLRMKGRTAILGFLKGFLALKLTVQDTVLTSRVQGDIGIKSGNYVIRDASGKDVDHGKWIEAWRREKGQWRMTHDIWNSDVPTPAPAS